VVQDSPRIKVRMVGESDSSQENQPSSQGAASTAAVAAVMVAETTSLHLQQRETFLSAATASTTSGMPSAAPSFQVPMSSEGGTMELSPQPSSKEDLGGSEEMEHDIAGEEEEDAARKMASVPCSSEIQGEEDGGFNVDSTEEVMTVDRGAGEVSPEVSETQAGLVARKEEEDEGGRVGVEQVPDEVRERLEERQEEGIMEPADTTQEGKVISFYLMYFLAQDECGLFFQAPL